MANDGIDRRRISGIRAALKAVMGIAGTGAADMSRRFGISGKYVYSAMRADVITGKTLDVLAMCGYRIAFVPADAALPNGSVILPDREPIDPETMLHRRKEADHGNEASQDNEATSGYVEYISR